MRAHGRHRECRPHRPARHFLRECWETSRSAITSKPRRSGTRGRCSPRSTGCRPTGSGSRSISTMTKSVDLWRRLGVPAGRIQRLAGRTTTGRWASARAVRPVIGDLLRPGPAVGEPGGPAAETANATSSCGIWCSMQNIRRRGRRQGRIPGHRRAATQEHRHRGWAWTGSR